VRVADPRGSDRRADHRTPDRAPDPARDHTVPARVKGLGSMVLRLVRHPARAVPGVLARGRWARADDPSRNGRRSARARLTPADRHPTGPAIFRMDPVRGARVAAWRLVAGPGNRL